jgi:hypothetical protein
MNINIAELQVGEMILNYKSIYALQRESRELDDWFKKQWTSITQVADLAKAMLGSNGPALTKVIDTDAEIEAAASADVASLKKRFPNLPVDHLQDLALGHRMATVLAEYRTRSDTIEEEKRRSRRLNEAWNSTPPGGQWLRPTLH